MLLRPRRLLFRIENLASLIYFPTHVSHHYSRLASGLWSGVWHIQPLFSKIKILAKRCCCGSGIQHWTRETTLIFFIRVVSDSRHRILWILVDHDFDWWSAGLVGSSCDPWLDHKRRWLTTYLKRIHLLVTSPLKLHTRWCCWLWWPFLGLTFKPWSWCKLMWIIVLNFETHRFMLLLQ